ncbi:MFS transporter [Acidobacteria bacterium AB60]|nr:MFS transporter [Acidobacteria bacterium AB60]
MTAGPQMQDDPSRPAAAEVETFTAPARPRQTHQAIRALRNPNFRLFWSGNFLSNIGTWMQNVAQGWLVISLTNSAFWLGVVSFAGSIPFLFFTLFGGVIADRANKRRLLLFTQTAMMLLAFLLAALAFLKGPDGHPIITVWEIALIAFLNGVAQSMNAPSYQALVPRLVEREDLTNALALNSAQFNMSRILGPTLGGYAMALVGVAGNFFLNGLSFLAVLWALVRMRYPQEKLAPRQGMLRSLRAGFAYLHSEREMLVLMWMTLAVSFFGIPFLNFIPYFAKVQLNVGESGLGWLMACSGIGAVLAAMIVAATGVIRHRGKLVTVTGIVFFLAIIGFSYSRWFALSECLAFVEGFNGILMVSCFNVSIQHLSSDEMRGRIMSIYATSFLGLPPLGSLLAGELSRHIPTGHALAAMAGTALLCFIGFFSFSPALRSLD